MDTTEGDGTAVDATAEDGTAADCTAGDGTAVDTQAADTTAGDGTVGELQDNIVMLITLCDSLSLLLYTYKWKFSYTAVFWKKGASPILKKNELDV